MSSSSRREATTRGRRSPARGCPGRAQVEPTAALAAVLIVGAALATFVSVYDRVHPEPGPSNAATLTLERLHNRALEDGAVRPARLAIDRVCPAGRTCNVTLVAGDRRWSVGSPAPEGTAMASRPVAVAVEPGRHRAGTLTVEVWA